MNQDKIRKLETIEAYVRGHLSQPEIECLWIEILKEPDLLGYLETFANLYAMAKESQKQ